MSGHTHAQASGLRYDVLGRKGFAWNLVTQDKLLSAYGNHGVSLFLKPFCILLGSDLWTELIRLLSSG